MRRDVTRVMYQAKARQWKKEDQEDLAQETWLRTIISGHQNEPKYMTAVLQNIMLRNINNKRIREQYAQDVELAFYTKDVSLNTAHLKGDIIKCTLLLNQIQKRIFNELASNPEGTQEEWAKNLNIGRRNLGYHLLNIRAIFKSLLEDNQIPTHSVGYLKDRRFNG